MLADDAQVRAQREPDLLRRRQPLRDGVERRVERRGARAGDLPEQVLLRVDVVVERGLLDPERLGEIGQRRAVVAAVGEEPRRGPRQLLAPGGHGLR